MVNQGVHASCIGAPMMQFIVGPKKLFCGSDLAGLSVCNLWSKESEK